MTATAVAGAASLLMSRLTKYRQKAEEINTVCESHGLPPALDISFEDDVRVRLDPKYRMEGFGVVFGFPLKLSFYVHYRKGHPDHVAIGKFKVPIAFGDIAKI